MSIKSDEFFSTMLDFLPSAKSEYEKSIEHYGKVLETVIIEDIFMPDILKLLDKEKDIKLIQEIFDYFEDISKNADKHLTNIFSITALEILGNDPAVLKKAKKYMGNKTIQLQMDADRKLGRIVDSF